MKRKIYIKNWILTCILVVSLITIVGASSYLATSYFSLINTDNNSYVLRDMISSNLPVGKEVEKKIIKPYNDENVKVIRDYYKVDGDRNTQENSLILYENTYMPNTGILYGSDEAYDVLSIYEGTVKNVSEDDVFGFIVEIEYSNNFIAKYSSLASVEVAKEDNVSIGEVIGKSGKNKIISESQNMLLLEIIYDGVNVDPKDYFDKNLEEMR